MFYLFLKPFRLVGKALLSESSPRQLAAGFAMGMVVGLVPKGNLIAVVLMMILAASKVNVGIGMISAMIFSWVGTFTDAYTHKVGLWLLEMPMLQSFWTAAYNKPIVPWTAFNNTVVLGSLVCGLIALWPVYFLSCPIWERYTDSVVARMKKYKLLKVLFGAEIMDRLGSV